MSQDEIASLFKRLSSPPKNAGTKWFQQRGFDFEKLLIAILTRDDLFPRTSYKPEGEQIDGSFLQDGRVFLLEAKWRSDPVPASMIYQFKGKVEGKLIGTIGFFISMSGYTKECVDALVLGKSLNVLLLDDQDVNLAVSRGGAFRELVVSRLREAAETGSVYQSVTRADVRAETPSTRASWRPAAVADVTEGTDAPNSLVIVCEGRHDSRILQGLALRILKDARLTADIRVVQCGGKHNLSRTANLFSASSRSATIIIVADADGNAKATRQLIREGLSYDRFHLATPNPSIEAWLLGGSAPDAAAARAGPLVERVQRSTKGIDDQIDALDLNMLRQTDRQFAEFWKAVHRAGHDESQQER